MTSQSGFSAIIILIIIGVLVVGGGITAFMYFTNQANPLLPSRAYTPAQNLVLPKSDTDVGFKPQETATPGASPVASPSPTPTVPLSNITIPVGSVDVQSLLSADKKTLTVSFLSSSNFSGLTTVSYTITYTADSGLKSVQGTFNLSGQTTSSNSSGQQYIQKIITLGTCSSGTCVYDTNPTAIRLSVSAK